MAKPSCYPERFVVPDEYRSPCVLWPDYHLSEQHEYTAEVVYENSSDNSNGGRWADPTSIVESDELLMRQTFYGSDPPNLKALEHVGVQFISGIPINPWERTGLTGRGLLGKFGPNHAADPILVRFNTTNMQFQFVAIKRNDTKQWAIPGGMVDAGETVSETLCREFTEEALAGNTSQLLDTMFETSHLVYRGYANDMRNTDNAWIETEVRLFWPNDNSTSNLLLAPCADEALASKWINFSDIHFLDFFSAHQKYLTIAKDMCMNMLSIMSPGEKLELMKSVPKKKRTREEYLI